jgi:hypothetical protein
MTATVKMTFTEDTDLIGWWNSIPRGTRNAVMKDMMRDYIERNRGGFRPVMPRNMPHPFDPLRFTQMCEDAAWIRSALNDLPGYMERVISHAVAMQPAGVTHGSYAREPTVNVDDSEANRREERVKKAKW